MANDRIYTIGNELLNAVNNHFATKNVELPERQYVHYGEVAWDCPSLVASMVGFSTPHNQLGVSEQFPNIVLPGVPFTRHVSFEVWLLLSICAIPGEDGDFPTEEQLDTDGEMMLINGWLLYEALLVGAAAGSVLEGGCQSIDIGECVPVGPDGAMAGWQSTVSIVL